MLRQIFSAKEIRDAWKRLQSACLENAIRVEKKVGYQGGAFVCNLIVRKDLGIWAIPAEKISGRIWCPFGILPENIDEFCNSNKIVSMTVQINPAVGQGAKGTAGLLASDIVGDRWICHTGRVGGGRRGISKKAFLKWTDRKLMKVHRTDKIAIGVFPLVRVADSISLSEIANFVHEVAAFKSGESSPSDSLGGTLFGGSEDESEGSSLVECPQGYKMVRSHAEIRNRLRDLLKMANYSVHRDLERDIIIGDTGKPNYEFEVKSSNDSQSVYTGVGQLLMHSAVCPSARKVLVVPEGLQKRRLKAVRKLGVELIEYRIDKHTIHFDSLGVLVPGVQVEAVKR